MTEQQERKPTDYTGVIIGAVLLPVVFVFIHFGQENMGRSVCLVLAAVMVGIRARWDLRKRFWFWAVILLLLALHIPLFLRAQWPEGWVPAIVMLPIAVADCLIIVGVVRLIEKFIFKNVSTDEEQ